MSQMPTSPDLREVQIPCPQCGQPTNRLKRYGMLNRVVFVVIAAHVRHAPYVACLRCMRKKAIGGLLSPLNFVLANLMWLLAWLPYTIGILIASTLPGHSKAIRHALERAQDVSPTDRPA